MRVLNIEKNYNDAYYNFSTGFMLTSGSLAVHWEFTEWLTTYIPPLLF